MRLQFNILKVGLVFGFLSIMFAFQNCGDLGSRLNETASVARSSELTNTDSDTQPIADTESNAGANSNAAPVKIVPVYNREDGPQSVLYNPGPKYAAGITLARPTLNSIGQSSWGSNLTQAHLVGNPADSCNSPHLIYDGMGNSSYLPVATNKSCPTFYTDTRVGWLASDLNKTPGWSIWFESGGNGTPYELTYLNHARGTHNPCELREIGLVYSNWMHGPHSMYKRRHDGAMLTLGDFSKVRVKLKAKLNYFSPPTCAQYPTAKVVVDFRVGLYNAQKTEHKRGYILTVLLFGMDGVGVDGKPHADPNTPVYFSGGGTLGGTVHHEMIQLYGTKLAQLGLPPQPRLSTAYQQYDIDFKQLFKAYLQRYSAVPQGYTADDAVLDGLDIYTSTQGGDLDFTVHDVDIIGEP